jgi:hypothetical protein
MSLDESSWPAIEIASPRGHAATLADQRHQVSLGANLA